MPTILKPKKSNPRVIHISDLHFSQSLHTLDSGKNSIVEDYQNSPEKSDIIASGLIDKASSFANTVIITGDLTDSGDEADYATLIKFLDRLKESGFNVYALPGNHDYCKEGNIIGAIIDQASNKERRQRFVDKIMKYLTPDFVEYPFIKDLGNCVLIMMDSMQAELDEDTGDHWAQGKLGNTQLSKLRAWLEDPKHQSDRIAGKKIIVGLHHSPFQSLGSSNLGGLNDFDAFLNIVSNKIDCLLFGHTTPPGMYQQDFTFQEKQYGIPLINCENLEYMGSTYPITLLDIALSKKLVVYARKARLILTKLVCIEPATRFGDDIEIFVNNISVIPRQVAPINEGRGEIKIDKGQTYNINKSFGIADQAQVSFKEDSDDVGQIVIDTSSAGKGEQSIGVKIKSDGRYLLYFVVENLPTPTWDNPYIATQTLTLKKIVCVQPATSFGDDIEILVDSVPATAQFPIDKGQTHDLGQDITFSGQVLISFNEDSDAAGQLVVDSSLAGIGEQQREVKIKEDGRYVLFFEVKAKASPVPGPNPTPNQLILKRIVCNEPATSFGDDIEIYVNNIPATGQFPIDKGQCHDLGQRFNFTGQAHLAFKEDSDDAGQIVIDTLSAGKGEQSIGVNIKNDGRYVLYFEVM